MSYLVMILMVVLWTAVGFLAGNHMGIAEGRSMATKEILKTNPPSQELEMACVGLWVGEQNKKYWEKGNASKSK